MTCNFGGSLTPPRGCYGEAAVHSVVWEKADIHSMVFVVSHWGNKRAVLRLVDVRPVKLLDVVSGW